VVEAVLERIARHDDPAVWIHRPPADELRARARALERRGDRPPLLGVPFAVKDNIDVAGWPTTAACPAFAYTPERSASVVTRLEDAGAILVGKTNLDQFATGLVGVRSPYGVPRNAVDARYIPGGSSSGSAVAVAAGLVDFALGTDTAGSGRVPAAFNNIVGLKPSCGAISTAGVVPACRTLDCVSIFARTCAEAARVYAVAAGFDAADPYSRAAPADAPRIAMRRFGVPRTLEFFGDRAAEARYARAIAHLGKLGLDAVTIDDRPLSDAAALLYGGPWVAERWLAVQPLLERAPEAFHPVTREIIAAGAKYSAADTFRALYRLQALKAEAALLWERCDVIALPTAPTIYTVDEVLADPVRLNTRLGTYTNFVNLLDMCAVAIPAGLRPDGLPFGLSLIAPAWRETALLALGTAAAVTE